MSDNVELESEIASLLELTRDLISMLPEGQQRVAHDRYNIAVVRLRKATETANAVFKQVPLLNDPVPGT